MTEVSDRYGHHQKQRPRWFWPLVAAIGISIGVAWAAWSAFTDVPQHQARVYGYDVVDDHTTTVSIDVFRDAPIALTCSVYAQAEDKTIVGEKTVEVPASDDPEVRIDIEITTERRAVTGRLRGCEPR